MPKFSKLMFALLLALAALGWGWHSSEYQASILDFALTVAMVGLIAWTVARSVQRRRRQKLEEMRDSALW